jgi:hypothetical protein
LLVKLINDSSKGSDKNSAGERVEESGVEKLRDAKRSGLLKVEPVKNPNCPVIIAPRGVSFQLSS